MAAVVWRDDAARGVRGAGRGRWRRREECEARAVGGGGAARDASVGAKCGRGRSAGHGEGRGPRAAWARGASRVRDGVWRRRRECFERGRRTRVGKCFT